MSRPTLVVFSHLRWACVFQRPQHVMTRMAADRPVLFVEEPVKADGGPRWEVSTPAPGVTVCRPHTPVDRIRAEPERDQLAALHHPVLPPRKLRDRPIDRGLRHLTAHIAAK